MLPGRGTTVAVGVSVGDGTGTGGLTVGADVSVGVGTVIGRPVSVGDGIGTGGITVGADVSVGVGGVIGRPVLVGRIDSNIEDKGGRTVGSPERIDDRGSGGKISVGDDAG